MNGIGVGPAGLGLSWSVDAHPDLTVGAIS
jgi:hypothetical protein